MNSIKMVFTVLGFAALTTGCQKVQQGSGNHVTGASSAAAASASGKIVSATGGPVVTGAQVVANHNPMTFDLAAPAEMSLVSGSWDFGDGSAVESSLGPITHTYNRVGSYLINVAVVDGNQQTFNISYPVTIIGFFDGLSCVSATAISAPAQALVGQPVNVSVSIPACLTSWVTSISWNFGDNTPAVTGNPTSHTFAAAGTYTLTASVISSLSNGETFFVITQPIVIADPVVPTPTPGASPAPSATPVPTPTPAVCPSATRDSFGADTTSQVACGASGTKTMIYHAHIVEACSVKENAIVWTETSRAQELVSEGACQGQSCTLPDGTSLANGASRTLYSTRTASGQCGDVAQARTCNNGVLGGSSSYSYNTCRSGCGSFGVDGTVKTGVISGQVSVPVVCTFNESGINSIYSQLIDQTCTDGSIVSSNTRQGALVSQGQCPTYAWVGTESWSACSANCGGQQTRAFECRDAGGVKAANERCAGAAPVEARICDGNPDAAKRSEVSTSQDSSGSSTNKCPASQIGVIVSTRDVTKTDNYACVDHVVKIASSTVSNGPWVTESYCKDYVAYRCSQDSLSNDQAEGRYEWMLKCQDQIPAIKTFLTEFANVNAGGYTISTTRHLYPTFMQIGANTQGVKNSKGETCGTVETPWIAPITKNANCTVPTTAYVAAVCLSSCATPEQEIMVAEAEAKLKMRYVPFIEALTKNYAHMMTLKNTGSMSSTALKRTAVSQWVTELIDTEHDIREFHMQSGRVLKVTPNHPVVSEDGTMKLASEFRIGMSLVELGGHLDQIVSINDTKYYGKVYNVLAKSSDIASNIVVTQGYLNGTAYFQNDGAANMNRTLFRSKLLNGVFEK